MAGTMQFMRRSRTTGVTTIDVHPESLSTRDERRIGGTTYDGDSFNEIRVDLERGLAAEMDKSENGRAR